MCTPRTQNNSLHAREHVEFCNALQTGLSIKVDTKLALFKGSTFGMPIKHFI